MSGKRVTEAVRGRTAGDGGHQARLGRAGMAEVAQVAYATERRLPPIQSIPRAPTSNGNAAGIGIGDGL